MAPLPCPLARPAAPTAGRCPWCLQGGAEGELWGEGGATAGRFVVPASCFTFWTRHAEAKAAFVPRDVAEARADVLWQHLGQVPAQGFGCFVGVTVQHGQQDLVPAGLDLLHHLEGARL